MREIARSSPDLAVLMASAQIGHQGFEIETFQQVDNYQVVERRFASIVMGYDVVRVPTVTHTVKRYRFI